MRSIDRRVPVENTVRALRRLAPGAALRKPRDPDAGEGPSGFRAGRTSAAAGVRGLPGRAAAPAPGTTAEVLVQARPAVRLGA
ncbi:hypothetical protein OHS18_22220 [Amycolatopsis sp. NBC_00355]|uniref:hypothetical protein n=1 Tax=Amycolatopsis sp. NBC_00355 TaxID=2975957 RepID=UPI002E253DE8